MGDNYRNKDGFPKETKLDSFIDSIRDNQYIQTTMFPDNSNDSEIEDFNRVQNGGFFEYHKRLNLPLDDLSNDFYKSVDNKRLTYLIANGDFDIETLVGVVSLYYSNFKFSDVIITKSGQTTIEDKVRKLYSELPENLKFGVNKVSHKLSFNNGNSIRICGPNGLKGTSCNVCISFVNNDSDIYNNISYLIGNSSNFYKLILIKNNIKNPIKSYVVNGDDFLKFGKTIETTQLMFDRESKINDLLQ